MGSQAPNSVDLEDFTSLKNAVIDEISWLIKFNCDMEGDMLHREAVVTIHLVKT